MVKFSELLFSLWMMGMASTMLYPVFRAFIHRQPVSQIALWCIVWGMLLIGLLWGSVAATDAGR